MEVRLLLLGRVGKQILVVQLLLTDKMELFEALDDVIKVHFWLVRVLLFHLVFVDLWDFIEAFVLFVFSLLLVGSSFRFLGVFSINLDGRRCILVASILHLFCESFVFFLFVSLLLAFTEIVERVD